MTHSISMRGPSASGGPTTGHSWTTPRKRRLRPRGTRRAKMRQSRCSRHTSLLLATWEAGTRVTRLAMGSSSLAKAHTRCRSSASSRSRASRTCSIRPTRASPTTSTRPKQTSADWRRKAPRQRFPTSKSKRSRIAVSRRLLAYQRGSQTAAAAQTAWDWSLRRRPRTLSALKCPRERGERSRRWQGSSRRSS